MECVGTGEGVCGGSAWLVLERSSETLGRERPGSGCRGGRTVGTEVGEAAVAGGEEGEDADHGVLRLNERLLEALHKQVEDRREVDEGQLQHSGLVRADRIRTSDWAGVPPGEGGRHEDTPVEGQDPASGGEQRGLRLHALPSLMAAMQASKYRSIRAGRSAFEEKG